MYGFQTYKLTYKRSGVSKKDGPNKDRAFFILQFSEEDERNDGQTEGVYTYTVFVWADETKDITFVMNEYYDCVIDSQSGKDRLVAVNYST